MQEQDKYTTFYDTPNLPKNEAVNSAVLDTLEQPVPLGISKGLRTLRKRSISKYFTNKLIFPLIDQKSCLQKNYWQTYHCVKTHLQTGTKITAKYCGKRWCIVCNRVRMARLLNGYQEQMKALPDLRFVTLTVPNVTDVNLSGCITEMVNEIILIQKQFRKKCKHKIVGIRKIEITYNPRLRNFHPHLHFILSGKQVGDELLHQWLQRNPSASNLAQDNRECTDLKEAFKYGCKLYKSSKRKDGTKVIQVYPPKALDIMFRSLVGRRIIQPMGGLRMVNEELNDLVSTVNVEQDRTEIWTWEQEYCDWVNAEWECLAGGAVPEVKFVNGS